MKPNTYIVEVSGRDGVSACDVEAFTAADAIVQVNTQLDRGFPRGSVYSIKPKPSPDASDRRGGGREGEDEDDIDDVDEVETAWLVEREKPGFGPRYLCFDMLFDWGPYSRALRFLRREDAEAMIAMGADVAAEFSLGPPVVTEHEWVPHPVTKSLSGEDNPASALRSAGREDSEVRPVVAWFAAQMETVLRANDHKGGWENCDIGYLKQRLREECTELEMALDSAPFDQAIREAADVANFAMMIADSLHPKRTLSKSEPPAPPEPGGTEVDDDDSCPRDGLGHHSWSRKCDDCGETRLDLSEKLDRALREALSDLEHVGKERADLKQKLADAEASLAEKTAAHLFEHMRAEKAESALVIALSERDASSRAHEEAESQLVRAETLHSEQAARASQAESAREEAERKVKALEAERDALRLLLDAEHSRQVEENDE